MSKKKTAEISPDTRINARDWYHWPVGGQKMEFRQGDVFISPAGLPKDVFDGAVRDRLVVYKSEEQIDISEEIKIQTNRFKDNQSTLLTDQNKRIEKVVEAADRAGGTLKSGKIIDTM